MLRIALNVYMKDMKAEIVCCGQEIEGQTRNSFLWSIMISPTDLRKPQPSIYNPEVIILIPFGVVLRLATKRVLYKC